MTPEQYNRRFNTTTIKKNKVIKEKNCLTEHEEQVILVKWLDNNGYVFTSIPNSTWTPGYSQQRKNSAEGLRAGLPDLLVIVRGRLVWIEMKKTDRKPKRGGKGGVSEAQRQWIEDLNKCEGCSAHVAYGAEEAINKIKTLDKMSTIC